MQPTYMPWLGYLSLVDRADCFVFLDSVQFNKRSWQQRNSIKGRNGTTLMTVPVVSKGKRYQQIYEVEIDRPRKILDKHAKTIYHNYKKAPYFLAYYQELAEILRKPNRLLCDLNIQIILWFMKKIGITTSTVRSSALNTSSKKTELLCEVCNSVDASIYLSAMGSKKYIQKNNLFKKYNIKLMYNNFQHPRYRQLFGPFTPYLSTLDLLFNEGPASLEIIRSGNIFQF